MYRAGASTVTGMVTDWLPEDTRIFPVAEVGPAVNCPSGVMVPISPSTVHWKRLSPPVRATLR